LVGRADRVEQLDADGQGRDAAEEEHEEHGEEVHDADLLVVDDAW
jgi:hypothetical protein